MTLNKTVLVSSELIVKLVDYRIIISKNFLRFFLTRKSAELCKHSLLAGSANSTYRAIKTTHVPFKDTTLVTRNSVKLKCVIIENMSAFLGHSLWFRWAPRSTVWESVIYRVIEKDGRNWNRYNLKSTGRIYTFCVLKCSEEFKVLDLLTYSMEQGHSWEAS